MEKSNSKYTYRHNYSAEILGTVLISILASLAYTLIADSLGHTASIVGFILVILAVTVINHFGYPRLSFRNGNLTVKSRFGLKSQHVNLNELSAISADRTYYNRGTVSYLLTLTDRGGNHAAFKIGAYPVTGYHNGQQLLAMIEDYSRKAGITYDDKITKLFNTNKKQ